MAGGAKAPELAGLSQDDWISAFDDIAEERGCYQPLGADHSAAFGDAGPVLLVTFETLAKVRERPGQLPLGFELADARGWSQLCLLAHHETWYRDRRVWGYFDRLVDDGFFEDFDRVIFLGGGIGGYAACAFSVAAPGATVIAAEPRATLDPARASWDRRFTRFRRLDFTSRYGFAPQMIEAADRAFLFFDPDEHDDAIHAAFFTCENVTPVPMRHFGTDLLTHLIRLGALGPLLDAAASEAGLTAGDAYRALRARRNYMPYLRHLITRLEADNRPLRLGKATRVLVERHGRKRFRKVHAETTRRLAERGLTLPVPAAVPAEAL
jgi:hypothetical protein